MYLFRYLPIPVPRDCTAREKAVEDSPASSSGQNNGSIIARLNGIRVNGCCTQTNKLSNKAVYPQASALARLNLLPKHEHGTDQETD